MHGWHGALLAVRMTQIPSWRLPAQAAQAVPLACVDGAGASLSRMEARKRGACVSTLFPLSLSRHRGGAGRQEGYITDMASAYFMFNWLAQSLRTCTAGHQAFRTSDQVRWHLNGRLS